MPSSLLSWYSPLNGGSVPFMRVTRYCSEVNWSCHSASVFWIFLGVSVMPVFYHATLKVQDTRTSQTPRPAGLILLRRPSLFAFHSGFIAVGSYTADKRKGRKRAAVTCSHTPCRGSTARSPAWRPGSIARRVRTIGEHGEPG